MKTRTADKITRKLLRSMKSGERVMVQCANGYELESQRNTAYAMQKLENCRFCCTYDGLTLTVIRYDQ